MPQLPVAGDIAVVYNPHHNRHQVIIGHALHLRFDSIRAWQPHACLSLHQRARAAESFDLLVAKFKT